jgi:tRNA (guanine9-N1)-methyltransferase
VSIVLPVSSTISLLQHHRKMSDLEERPSKIRKLGTENSQDEPPPKITLNDENHDENHSSPPNEKIPSEVITAPEQTGDTQVLSKSQQKKLRKKAEWEAGKDYRKAKRKEQHKAKIARKAEARKEAQEKIANGEVDSTPKVAAEEAKQRPRRPIQVPVTFILDCDFDEYMAEKEIISLGAQITRCYSDNKSNPYRAHLVMSSWRGRLKDRFETVLANTHLLWKGVKFLEKDFVAAAAELNEIMRSPDGGKLIGALAGEGEGTSEVKPVLEISEKANDGLESLASAEILPSTLSERAEGSVSTLREAETTITPTNGTLSKSEPSIVYLSSDSPHTLERLSPNTTYIIGGIVDKNRHKGLCYKRACERGIATAKLPIGEYMTMQSRTVLTVNHVVEIMLKWLETGDWGDAFLAVIPKRKEAKLKVKKENLGDENDYEGGGDESDEEDEPLSEHNDNTSTNLVEVGAVAGTIDYKTDSE